MLYGKEMCKESSKYNISCSTEEKKGSANDNRTVHFMIILPVMEAHT